MHTHDAPLVARTGALLDAISAACGRIAPNWPLDQMIAVNPWWGWVDQPMPQAAAWLGALAGTRLSAPLIHARQAWREGRLQADDLDAACRHAGHMDAGWRSAKCAQLAARLTDDAEPPAPARLPLLSHLAVRPLVHAAQPARDAVVHQISQHCAVYFDDAQGGWHPDRNGGLWGSWKRQLAGDRGLAWAQGAGWPVQALQAWPDDAVEAIGHGLGQLPLPQDAWAAYLSALLLDVNGWAAWCAWQRWQARLAGSDDAHLTELLAIRLAWEVLLQQDQDVLATAPGWARSWSAHEAAVEALAKAQQDDWLLQLGLELAYQRPLAQSLAARLQGGDAGGTPASPSAQAVFCIDVRSEVFRRALESVAPGVATRGFAGFFGLPIAYSPAGTDFSRPQLPGLLAPAMTVTEGGTGLGQALRARRQAALQQRGLWERWRSAAGSAFSFVESCGLLYGAKLLQRALPGTGPAKAWEQTGLPGAAASGTPMLPLDVVGARQGVDLAAGILRAMGLTAGFAPVVLLAGHGSQSANNPQSAGLECGACGGQTGEVNARVLAALLNDVRVRAGLVGQGIVIPDATHFVPALHNTTTDDVQLFDLHLVPDATLPAVRALQAQLAGAGELARRERAESLGLQADSPAAQLAAWVRRRANDWAQVRPEWGLANNAAFIVAPRARTRGLALDGRSFLHDYDWREDPQLSVLTLIMTAPMVVTHWINMQYHASTVDNARWGSGNKLLHNVVGGRIGVFEGNGGDLRIGLARQSVHDGTQWRHQPLRLTVWIEAPAQAIDSVLAAHATVRQLVEGGWLHLMRLDPQAGVERRTAQGWEAV